ncbi:MAG: hypothetical protein IK008_04565 [Bacteroidales bacterium]|nr:hypothetical protein [Bacteroidales bacterium]
MKIRSFIIALILAACTRAEFATVFVESTFILQTPEDIPTRAGSPDDAAVKDFNLLVFNAFGELEEHVFVSERELGGGLPRCTLRLMKDVPYTVIATANMGYKLPIRTLEEAQGFRYHLAYPDEYGPGIPMAVIREDVLPKSAVELRLERLMARMDLQTDRRYLDEGVFIKVTGVEVEACPSWVALFPDSRPLSRADIFPHGLHLSGSEVEALNREEEGTGLSGVLSLYVLENCQGDDPFPAVTTRISVRAEYHSPQMDTEAGETLTYRFYPRETCHDLVRNTVYPIVLKWEGEGLTEDPEDTFSENPSNTGW